MRSTDSFNTNIPQLLLVHLSMCKTLKIQVYLWYFVQQKVVFFACAPNSTQSKIIKQKWHRKQPNFTNEIPNDNPAYFRDVNLRITGPLGQFANVVLVIKFLSCA